MGNNHRRSLVALLFASTVVLVAIAASTAAAQGPSINAAPQAGTVWERGLAKSAGRGHSSSQNLTYHGGPVMTGATKVQPIFWGTSWPSYSGDEMSGIDAFYGGIGGTRYAGSNQEYTDAAGHVSTSISASTHAMDSSAAPSHAPSTSAVLAEVAKLYPSPSPDGYYPVYIDQPRGSAGYCAWHSSGTINGTHVEFAFFFKLDGDAGCDPQSPVTSNSEGLNASANVSGHELSEMLTDEDGNAWYDSKGAENADKCAWTFGSSLLKLGSDSWRIQGNWSNSAYNANRGYTDSSSGFVRGCIDGTNA